jgi:hypothetical protein
VCRYCNAYRVEVGKQLVTPIEMGAARHTCGTGYRQTCRDASRHTSRHGAQMLNGDDNHASVAAGCTPRAWVSATVVKRDGLMPAKAQGRFEGSRVADLTHGRTRVLTRLELAKLTYGSHRIRIEAVTFTSRWIKVGLGSVLMYRPKVFASYCLWASQTHLSHMQSPPRAPTAHSRLSLTGSVTSQ